METNARSRHSVAPFLAPEERARINALFGVRSGQELSFADSLRDLARRHVGEPSSARLRAFCLVMADLSELGWAIGFETDKIVFTPPGANSGNETKQETKERIRRGLRSGRQRQLEESSTTKFLQRVEKVKERGTGRPASIADLIDDGQELSVAFRQLDGIEGAEREVALKRLVEPVVEVCTPDARCPETGLPLLEVWRYFRHTWAHEYRSVPGRQMCILIRNAARPNRPVMGIAMLASPVMRLTERDRWIGWLRQDLEDRLRDRRWKPRTLARAMLDQLDASISMIRSDDLIDDPSKLDRPCEATIFALEQRAAGAAFEREKELRRYQEDCATSGEAARPQRGPVGGPDDGTDWLAASEDLLFVRKRAEGLASLLFARRAFGEAGLAGTPTAAFKRLLADKTGCRAIDIVLAEFRKAGLSSQIADVSVCGAVHPYNEIIGGKLVALLLASKEVRQAYSDRYGEQVSIIASQMAGRPVKKPADLRILTTTSLYSTGSSQYARLILRSADHPELSSDLAWKKIGEGLTKGYGTLHLSPSTFAALSEIAIERHEARRVNNRFGEGTSPKMRQIREGLDALGLTSDHVLNHDMPRIFYGCELHHNARDTLMNLARGKKRSPSAAVIASAWRRRWLSDRVRRERTLAQLSELGPTSVKASLHTNEDGQFLLPIDA